MQTVLTRAIRKDLPPLVTAALLVAAPSPARAERPDLRVDVEPVAYVLRGYSVHLRVATPWKPRLVAGVGAYGFDWPAAMVDLVPANRDQDWDVRLTVGANLFVDYFFGASPRDGWLAGAQIGVQRWRLGLDGEEETAQTLLLMARVGYEWHPWPARGFYLFPWLGVAGNVALGGEPVVAGETYEVAPVVPYGAVELGWRW